MFQIRSSPRHGRGLFATCRIPAEVLVSEAVAVLVDNDTRLLLEASNLGGMFIDWDDDGTGALPLGPVTLVNHAEVPNCELAILDDEVAGPTVQLWTLATVEAGAELTVDYVAGDPERSVWFHASR